MTPDGPILALFDEFQAALGRPPSDGELIVNLADRLKRAEAGLCRGFLRLAPNHPVRPAKPAPPEPAR